MTDTLASAPGRGDASRDTRAMEDGVRSGAVRTTVASMAEREHPSKPGVRVLDSYYAARHPDLGYAMVELSTGSDGTAWGKVDFRGRQEEFSLAATRDGVAAGLSRIADPILSLAGAIVGCTVPLAAAMEPPRGRRPSAISRLLGALAGPRGPAPPAPDSEDGRACSLIFGIEAELTRVHYVHGSELPNGRSSYFAAGPAALRITVGDRSPALSGRISLGEVSRAIAVSEGEAFAAGCAADALRQSTEPLVALAGAMLGGRR